MKYKLIDLTEKLFNHSMQMLSKHDWKTIYLRVKVFQTLLHLNAIQSDTKISDKSSVQTNRSKAFKKGT
jgi:hypothetical protein